MCPRDVTPGKLPHPIPHHPLPVPCAGGLWAHMPQGTDLQTVRQGAQQGTQSTMVLLPQQRGASHRPLRRTPRRMGVCTRLQDLLPQRLKRCLHLRFTRSSSGGRKRKGSCLPGRQPRGYFRCVEADASENAFGNKARRPGDGGVPAQHTRVAPANPLTQVMRQCRPPVSADLHPPARFRTAQWVYLGNTDENSGGAVVYGGLGGGVVFGSREPFASVPHFIMFHWCPLAMCLPLSFYEI